MDWFQFDLQQVEFHILLKNWPFNVKPQENFHPVIIQVVCNSIIMIFCLVFSFFAYEEINFLRFCTDFFFSTLILIPLGIWNLNFFCDLFTVLRISSKISEQTIWKYSKNTFLKQRGFCFLNLFTVFSLQSYSFF